MGTDTGGGMRGFVPLQVFLSLVFVTGAPSYAGDPGSFALTSSASLAAEISHSCERPSDNHGVVVESEVSAIWQVDLSSVQLGYIDDDYVVADAIDYALGGYEPAVAETMNDGPQGGMGVRLDNGWSLGFTYELLDARFKVGPFLLPEPGDPVFEGPKFVATLKFR